MKFGLKIWSSNYSCIGEIKKAITDNLFQYVELMVVPGIDVKPFAEVKIPYAVHVPHIDFGFNMADKSKEQFNISVIKECVNAADILSAKYIVVHPGWGNIDGSLDFFNRDKDRRMIIENVPKVYKGREAVCSTPEEMKIFISHGAGFCLDFGHALAAAKSLGKNWKSFVRQFFKMNPLTVHISDGITDDEKDDHMNIGEGDYDLAFLAKYVKKSNPKYVLLETPRNNLASFEEDVNNLIELKKWIGEY